MGEKEEGVRKEWLFLKEKKNINVIISSHNR